MSNRNIPSESEALELLERARREGRSLAELSREGGYSLPSVYRWSQKLRGRGHPTKKGEERSVTFLRLKRRPSHGPEGTCKAEEGLTIEISGASIRVRRHEDLGLLIELMKALGTGSTR